MTQKQLITANNAELEKHKQDILSLPMADDVKNGKYVWGKYEYTPQQTISGTTAKISASRGTNIVLIRNCTTDLTRVDLNLNSAKFFFLNFEGSGIRFTQSGGNTYVQLGDGYDITKITNITPTGCDLTVSENVLAEYTNSVITQKLSVTIPPSKGSFLSYTVSDSETAYPDGGEKDGYWWEMVKERDNIAFGTITLSTSSYTPLTIEHGLGVIPTNFGFVKKGLKPYEGTFVSDMSRCGYGYGGTMYSQKDRTGTVDERIMVFGYENLPMYGFYQGTYMWFASEK